ncbi:hypothetical protein PYW08_000988 [Mythimna loreyi]|uniref:Uncharacterized protein n=1 Tax=Mythimna loreyi TaxID=667449 RepID=A0ACC2QZ37_9NEOP|nr:hypothetical protein PYW08_000988 [Mythimna loreyi]
MERGPLFIHLILLKWFAIIINAEQTENYNKSILRYGHHRVHKCNDFEKTYTCIRKCLDHGFDIASADKHCTCTCFKDKVKSEYYVYAKKDWTVPTTKIPYYAGKNPSNSQKETFVLVTPESEKSQEFDNDNSTNASGEDGNATESDTSLGKNNETNSGNEGGEDGEEGLPEGAPSGEEEEEGGNDETGAGNDEPEPEDPDGDPETEEQEPEEPEPEE